MYAKNFKLFINLLNLGVPLDIINRICLSTVWIHVIIQTRKIKFGSILFCIGNLICNGSIWLQLSRFYGLPPLVLSICYHADVITLA